MFHLFRDRDTEVFAFSVDWKGRNLPRHADTQWRYIETLDPVRLAWGEQEIRQQLSCTEPVEADAQNLELVAALQRKARFKSASLVLPATRYPIPRACRLLAAFPASQHGRASFSADGVRPTSIRRWATSSRH
jgi:hypothetical protein